jgi:UDP-N-acetylmuramate: L-alanyl-gamma-D-glutamyl-meso-diaminopimelate ligase
LEFDHADIYPDLSSIKAAFVKLVALIPPTGVLVACADWLAVMEVSAAARCSVVTYGVSPQVDWRLEDLDVRFGETRFTASHRDALWGEISLAMPGRHNALNALAVVALGEWLGLGPEVTRKGLASCRGVRRRQEVRGEVAGVTVVDDFAHHPTEVKATLDALRAAYGSRRLIAVFEPRTNTSRRRIFQDSYAGAFEAADVVMVREVPDPEKAPPGDRFSSEQLVSDLSARGQVARYFPDASAILGELLQIRNPGDVMVILSNGAFEGLHDRLLAALREQPA